MRESEAAYRWCPFTRMGNVTLGGTANRFDSGVNCLGSKCCIWLCDEEINGKTMGKGHVFDPKSGDCALRVLATRC